MEYRMTPQKRAKQFIPFMALKGYEEALRQKEKITVSKKELCEDYKEELEIKLNNKTIGDFIKVIYFEKGEYLAKEGILVSINRDLRYIQVVNTKIDFCNVYDIL